MLRETNQFEDGSSPETLEKLGHANFEDARFVVVDGRWL